MPKNVAIAIGIGAPDGYDPVPGARGGAEAFARWAETSTAEEYAVQRFIDSDTDRVSRGEVLRHIAALDDVGKLLIYFAGHGHSYGVDDDFWVFSGAAGDSGEFVNVRETKDNLKGYSRIPHIVFFSDACRTFAAGSSIQNMQGAGVLYSIPRGRAVSIATTIDVFHATKTGASAIELAPPGTTADQVNQSLVGVTGFFTDVILPALRGEVAEVVRVNSSGQKVVFANHLKAYCEREVPLVTGSRVPISQVPDADVHSSESLCIAVLEQGRQATLTLEARLPGGTHAGTAIVTILGDPAKPIPDELGTGLGRVSKVLPEGLIYGARVQMNDYIPAVTSPAPLTLHLGDATVQVHLFRPQPATVLPTTQPSLHDTYAIDGAGNRHETIGERGVYTMVTTDLLSGRSASELRILDAGTELTGESLLEADGPAESRIQREADAHLTSREARDHFETQMGLSVLGSRPVAAFLRGRVDAIESVQIDQRVFWHVRAYEPGSAVVQLEGERYAASAIFPGFLGSLTIGAAGTRGLSYAPTTNGDWYGGEESPDLIRAKALAEAAVRAGRFDVVINANRADLVGTNVSDLHMSEPRAFADAVRIGKHNDPVLGILAAYAYAQAGNIDQVRNMVGWFMGMNQFVPYDLVLLAGISVAELGGRVAPAYPLLTLGWSKLGEDAMLHPVIAEARRNLAPSLWATVVGEAGRRLGEAVRTGEVS